MRIVHHASHHILIHLGLFSGFALLIPVITKAFEQNAKPWILEPSIFFGGVMLVIISAFLLYRVKENMPDVLQSLGAMIFLPGAINVISGVINIHDFLTTKTSLSGMAVVKPIAQFYVEHSVPSVLSVAAVYLFIGGMLYWIGYKMQRVKDKFSFNN
ncbi:hypothetical protein HY489_05060 [Candidatus Woesearchaeota archaeon]|nr:hypothetical protein [Candidatus Woesearchaeota archaeon]